MKTLKRCKHINARTVEEAAEALKKYGEKGWALAGGTDLIGTMRFEALRDYPEAIINLKTIPGLDYIRQEEGVLRIGALTRLEDIAENRDIKTKYFALAEAARRTASPHVRAMGTIGGNICQIIRCWYFRKEDNRFDCLRKGGKMCHATLGDNRYHSIFGAARVGPPPCSSECLAGVDIPTYMSRIRANDLPEASAILLESNPLPAITGRVCPHPCEPSCNRGEWDEALAVHSVERYMGDYILENANILYSPPPTESGKRVAVVGAGPAGLSAAYYLRKQGHKITVYEALEEAGGVLTYGIPGYRLEKDVVRRQVKALGGMGIQFKLKTAVGKNISLTDLKREYDSVFLATGAWRQPSIGLEDEGLLVPGLEYLSRVNRGLRTVSARKMLVIGGGKVAIDVAITSVRMGMKDVTLACLESAGEMPAEKDEVEQAVREGVTVMPSWGPFRVLKDNGKVTGMELKKCLSVYDKEGRFAPVYDISVKQTIEADLVILATGQKPDLAYAGQELEMKRGLLAVDPQTQATNITQVYAGGDAAVDTAKVTVGAAVAAGRRAAEAINRYLGYADLAGREKAVEHLTRAGEETLSKLSRVKMPTVPLNQVSLDKEDVSGLNRSAVGEEAGRCFNCGCEGVNPSDVAAALVALDARIVTSKRTVRAEEFWTAERGVRSTLLDCDEIVTEIHVPAPKNGVKSAFIKFALRKAIDFPIVNCAAAVEWEGGVVKSSRICLNAVYCNPYRVTKAEDAIKGKTIDEASAELAGAAAISDAIALPYNKYKIQVAKAMVKRALLACR
jgi:NADPH-dependent glutamate synthase beta subunit-like oxidoreductase